MTIDPEIVQLVIACDIAIYYITTHANDIEHTINHYEKILFCDYTYDSYAIRVCAYECKYTSVWGKSTF